MLGHYERLLEGMAASPEIAIGRLGMLTAGERRQLVEEWNDTGRADQAGRCVHERFESRSSERPMPWPWYSKVSG